MSLAPKGKKPASVNDSILTTLDEFLLLISFATRWKTICLGWDIAQWPYQTKRYRHGLTLPSHLKGARHEREQNYETGLIAPDVLPDFLRHAWPLWMGMDDASREMLHQVLQAVVYAQSLDLHESFISHYATLEMMVLHFRQQNDLELIFSNKKDWKSFAKEVENFIVEKSSLAGSDAQQEIKRKKIYSKLQELVVV